MVFRGTPISIYMEGSASRMPPTAPGRSTRHHRITATVILKVPPYDCHLVRTTWGRRLGSLAPYRTCHASSVKAIILKTSFLMVPRDSKLCSDSITNGFGSSGSVWLDCRPCSPARGTERRHKISSVTPRARVSVRAVIVSIMIIVVSREE